MRTSREIAEHLSYILGVDAYLDDVGVTHTWLNAEEDRLMKELEEAIRNEARQREDRARAETGTNPAQGISSGREPDWEPPG